MIPLEKDFDIMTVMSDVSPKILKTRHYPSLIYAINFIYYYFFKRIFLRFTCTALLNLNNALPKEINKFNKN